MQLYQYNIIESVIILGIKNSWLWTVLIWAYGECTIGLTVLRWRTIKYVNMPCNLKPFWGKNENVSKLYAYFFRNDLFIIFVLFFSSEKHNLKFNINHFKNENYHFVCYDSIQWCQRYVHNNTTFTLIYLCLSISLFTWCMY